MKIRISYIGLLAVSALMFACKLDNYDPPGSMLSGQIAYQGEAIQLEYDKVPFRLFQDGFGKKGGSIDGAVKPDGTYSMLLFDGTYKFVISTGQGPFIWKQNAGKPDTVNIVLKGSQTMNFEVTPYYMIRTPKFTLGADSVVTAQFKAEKIITDANGKKIERVNIYVNKTQFVSSIGDQKIAESQLAGAAIVDPNAVTLKVKVPKLPATQKYFFARVGLKIEGVEDMIFSPVTKMQF
jgi:hypothetical protein